MIIRRIGSFAVSFLSFFVKINNKRILFLSFGGRQYSDSPKALYEAMRVDPKFRNYEMLWAFNDPDSIAVPELNKIKTDTLSYFICALSSKIWITNTSICRGLQFKKRGNICINTWHGMPLKKLGYSLDPNPKYKERIDIGCCQNDFDKKVFLRLFNVNEKDILKVDLPRNDALLKYTHEDLYEIKHKLNIPEGKKVLLYMPTYREYNLDSHDKIFLIPPLDFEKWEKVLGMDYVLIVRFHYLIEKMLDIPQTNFVINGTNYPNLNDLYAISDVLISDYSSSYIDYSILQRPMLCFGYDFEEYREFRGFELDFEEAMPCPIDRNEDNLLEHIINMDHEDAVKKVAVFHERFSPYAGHATESVIAELKKRLE